MSQRANTDILNLLRLADPVDLVELERAAGPLRERIKQDAMRGSVPSEPIPAGDRVALEMAAGRGAGPSRRRRWPALGFASMACAAVLALVILVSGGPLGSVGESAYPGFAQAAVRVAEANPRLLVTAPGWKIVEARSFRATDGQLQFSNGKKQLHLSWAPAAFYRESIKRIHAGGGRRVGTASIAGRTATVVYNERAALGSYAEAIFPPESGISVELDGAFTEGEWQRLMASVRAVGVERWLRAMPGEILRPSTFAAEIEQLLRGVPVPPGFDASAAVYPTQLTNRFQAAKRLTQGVTCSWVETWSAARENGEAAVAAEAVEAMTGAARWPVLLQMVREKGYDGDSLPAPGYLWPTSIIAIGKQMAAGHLERKRVATKVGGRVTAEGFSIPKGAYPPAAVTCFPSPATP